MDNPGKVATFGTQDTRRRQKQKQNKNTTQKSKHGPHLKQGVEVNPEGLE